MVDVPVRRVQESNAREVKDQLRRIGGRVEGDSLRRGDRGPAVEALQRRLRSFGVFHGKADGAFDQQTHAAVVAFQRKTGIAVDGVAGPQTLREIRSHTVFLSGHGVAGDDFATPAKRGQSGGDVRRAEVLLKDLGMAPGKVDGVYDKDTQAAVSRLRKGDDSLNDKGGINARVFDRLQERAARPLQRGGVTRGVQQLERNLKRVVLDVATVDRIYTGNTAEAVRKFQRRNHIEETGVADRATRAKLQRRADAVPTFADKLASWSSTAPRADYRRVGVDGETVNRRTDEMLKRATQIMQKRFGHEGFDFGIVQGSYSGSVAASGGTHDGGGALDVHTASYPQRTVDHMVKALRTAGFAAWSRGRGHDSFDPHIHAIAIGDRELSSSARAQVQDYFAGRSGLVGGAPDPDRDLGRNVPAWARRFD